MIGPLNQPVRQVRAVTVTAGQAVTINATPSRWFPARLVAPEEQDRPPEPRAARPHQLVYQAHNLTGPAVTLRPADRVATVTGTQWELVGPPSAAGDALAADVHRVTDLYPVTGLLEEQGGTDVQAGVPIAVWPATGERSTDRGVYTEFLGEAPAEHLAALTVTNRQLIVGAQKLKIVSAVLHVEVPRVEMALRRPGG